MDLYELLLFGHIVAAIIWLGSGLLLQVLAYRAERAGDDATLAKVADDAAQLAQVLFIPASLVVLLLGVALTIDGPWSLDYLWIVLGLLGYLATFLTGVLVMEPTSKKITQLVERDGGMSPEAMLETKKLLAKGRVDTVVLYLVVAVMVLKPTGDDVGLLVAMAVIVAAGLAWAAMRLRALDAEAGAAPRAAATA